MLSMLASDGRSGAVCPRRDPGADRERTCVPESADVSDLDEHR